MAIFFIKHWRQSSKEGDVVIPPSSLFQLVDQIEIIAAIKEAGAAKGKFQLTPVRLDAFSYAEILPYRELLRLKEFQTPMLYPVL